MLKPVIQMIDPRLSRNRVDTALVVEGTFVPAVDELALTVPSTADYQCNSPFLTMWSSSESLHAFGAVSIHRM